MIEGVDRQWAIICSEEQPSTESHPAIDARNTQSSSQHPVLNTSHQQQANSVQSAKQLSTPQIVKPLPPTPLHITQQISSKDSTRSSLHSTRPDRQPGLHAIRNSGFSLLVYCDRQAPGPGGACLALLLLYGPDSMPLRSRRQRNQA